MRSHEPKLNDGETSTLWMIDRTIGRLPERQQHIVRRHLFDRATDSAIADELGISRSVVCRERNSALYSLDCALNGKVMPMRELIAARQKAQANANEGR